MQHRHHTRPFGFDRIFAAAGQPEASRQDLELQLAALGAENAELSADRAAVLVRARADGFAAGLAQARAETTAALALAVGSLDAGLARLEAWLAETEARITLHAAEAALAAAELIAAQAIAADPAQPVEAAIGRVVAQLGRSMGLVIRVHPSLLAPLRERLAGLAGLARRPTLHFEGDQALVPGDTIIDWDTGGLTLERAARVAAVAAALGLDAEATNGGSFSIDNEAEFRPDDRQMAAPDL
jgi:flagellar assembly protein FliH